MRHPARGDVINSVPVKANATARGYSPNGEGPYFNIQVTEVMTGRSAWLAMSRDNAIELRHMLDEILRPDNEENHAAKKAT